jgi:hypothetical protein
VQYYDKNYNELCGSDSIWIFDQRFSTATIVSNVIERAAKQSEYYRTHPDKAVKQRAHFARIMRGDINNAMAITGYIHLPHNK